MAMPVDVIGLSSGRDSLIKHAVGLLSQQIWCWGRDILRPEGNWLIEIGFDRMEPPKDHTDCTSVYTLQLATERRIVLRGFGVFYGEACYGGVFLPRYEFQPKYTTRDVLESPPWLVTDLPKLDPPTEKTLPPCVNLTVSLIHWIEAYERQIVDRLGIEYRRSMLDAWDNKKGPTIPAEEMPRAWQTLGNALADDHLLLLPTHRTKRIRAHA